MAPEHTASLRRLCLLLSALSGSIALPAQSLPTPALQYAPTAAGSTLFNAGSNAGLSTAPNNLLLKTNTTNNFSTSPAANLIMADGSGPLGVGRAIDLSANAANGGAVTSMGGAASGISIGGPGAFTLTMWYRLSQVLPTTSTTLIRMEYATSNTSKVILSLNGQKLRLDVQTVAGASKSVTTSSVDTTMTQVGKWVFVAASWNAANGATALYKGFEDAGVAAIFSGTMATVGNLAPTSFVNLGFNNLTGGGTGAFAGQLADIRFYTSVLSASQLNLIKGGVTATDTSYLAVVKGWVDGAFSSSYSTTQLDALTAGTGAPNDGVSEIAAAFARMWLLTGKTNAAYADRAWYALNDLRGQWQRTTAAGQTWKIGFQARFAFLEAYQILRQNGYALDSAFQADIKAIAKTSAAPDSTSDNNVGAFNGAATVAALALWPDLDVAGTWTAAAIRQWNTWAPNHDTVENSLNYNKLFIPLTVFMAQRSASVASLAGYNFNADVQGDAMRTLLARFRDQVAGSGQMPYYGDAGNATPSPDMDNWPAVFEWAGRTWHDGTFRWAAQVAYDQNRTGKTLPLTIWLMTYAIDGADATVPPVPPATGSAVLTRNDSLSGSDPDKIVLAPSRAAGAPFAVADVFGHGWHNHKEQTGALGFFENNGSVFLYELGYNNRSSDDASMVLINPASTPFPWRGQPSNGTWYEAAIPTADMDIITDPADPNYGLTLVDRPEWRWEQRSSTTSGYGYLGNVRLVAADGTETVVNATNNASGWSGGLGAQVVVGPTPGTSALRFTIGPNTTGNSSTVARIPTSQAIGRAIDPKLYPYLKFWWKAESSVPIDDQIVIYREQYAFDGQLQQDEAWLQPFTPVTTAARVETGALARYGSFTISGYFTLNTQLTRRIAQLNDGTTVVLDTIRPDADAEGRSAGPVWQLAANAPTAIAPGVYDAAGFYNSLSKTTGADGLLVVMEQADGRSFGAQRPPALLWNNANPYATYAQQVLHTGQPASFVTVLQPHAASVSAATLASQVTIQRTGSDTATVLLGTGDGNARVVTFSANDTWSVTSVSLPIAASLSLGDLSATYDGSPKTASVVTVPAGVPVSVTYDGIATPPTNAGSYTVLAAATGPNYTGTSTGTLVIAPAAADVTVADSTQGYDGSPKTAEIATTPAGLPVNVTYNGGSAAPVSAGTYAVVATIADPNYIGSGTGTLTINPAPATITLGNVSQVYDGTPKSVTVVTDPANLPVAVTYDGSTTVPVNPGPHRVVATMTDPDHAATATATLTIGVTALVRHAPIIDAGVAGSVWVLSPENITLSGAAWISDDLLVPGTPSVAVTGAAIYAGVRDGGGSATPDNYNLTLAGRAVVRYVVRRTDPVPLAAVNAPPLPSGTRDVALRSANDSAGDFATIRNLAVSGNAGQVVVPPGTYGTLSTSGRAGFTFGVAGSTSAAVYALQSLTLNGSSQVEIVGPAVLIVAHSVTASGSTSFTGPPAWLTVRIASGGATLTGHGTFNGSIEVPSGTITLSGSTTLNGTVICDRLVINGASQLNQPE